MHSNINSLIIWRQSSQNISYCWILFFLFLMTWMKFWKACLADTSGERTCVFDQWGSQIILVRPRAMDQNQKRGKCPNKNVNAQCWHQEPVHSFVSLKGLWHERCSRGQSARSRATKRGWAEGVDPVPTREDFKDLNHFSERTGVLTLLIYFMGCHVPGKTS